MTRYIEGQTYLQPHSAQSTETSAVEQVPVPHFERVPYGRGVFDGVSDELALLSQGEVDLFFVVLTRDVRYVDGDEDVSALALEPDERHDNGSEIGRGA